MIHRECGVLKTTYEADMAFYPLPIAKYTVAAIGVLFSAWLTYLELAVIHAICIWCVTSALIVTVIFVVSVADYRETSAAMVEPKGS